LAESDLQELATKNELNLPVLKTCIAAPSTVTAINKDYAEGYKAGVEGTPTYFINGELAKGVVGFKVWEEFFKQF
jgi:protein-disulfide isomerase